MRSSMSVNFDSSSSQDRIVDSQLEISLLLSDMANTVSSTTHTLSRKHVFVHRLPQRNHCRAAIQCRNSDRFRKLHVSQSYLVSVVLLALSRVENCFVNPDACSLDQGRRFASSASSPKVLQFQDHLLFYPDVQCMLSFVQRMRDLNISVSQLLLNKR